MSLIMRSAGVVGDTTEKIGSLDATLGFLYIGVILSVWMFGFSCVQTYTFLTRYNKRDPRWLRAFVVWLSCLDAVITLLCIIFLYQYLIDHFGDWRNARHMSSTLIACPVVISIIALSTQLFYAWRIWRIMPFRRVRWVTVTSIVTCATISFAGAILVTSAQVRDQTFLKFDDNKYTVIIWLTFAVVADMIITVALIATLQAARNGLEKTDSMLSKLIFTALQTGLLTTSFAFLDLILFVASPLIGPFLFALPLAKLYYNSLLAMLNSRNSKMGNHHGSLWDTDQQKVGGSSSFVTPANVLDHIDQIVEPPFDSRNRGGMQSPEAAESYDALPYCDTRTPLERRLGADAHQFFHDRADGSQAVSVRSFLTGMRGQGDERHFCYHESAAGRSNVAEVSQEVCIDESSYTRKVVIPNSRSVASLSVHGTPPTATDELKRGQSEDQCYGDFDIHGRPRQSSITANAKWSVRIGNSAQTQQDARHSIRLESRTPPLLPLHRVESQPVIERSNVQSLSLRSLF